MSSEVAVSLVVWGVETMAQAVGVEHDTLEVRRLARAALLGRTSLDAVEQTLVFERLLRQVRLAGSPCQTLSEGGLPLVSLTQGGLALIPTEGDRFQVLRPGAEPETLDPEAARALFEGQPTGSWLAVAPAAPLQDARSSEEHHLSPLGRLRALMRLERDDLWVVLIYAAAAGLFSLATPIAVQSLVGSVAFGTLLQPLVVLSVLLLLALSFQAGLRALQTSVVETLQLRVFARLSLDLAWRLPRVRPEAEGFGPESANRFFEIVTIQKATATLLTDGVATVLQIAIGMGVLAFYHPTLFAFDLALMVLVALVVFAPFGNGLKTSIAESYAKYDVAEWLQQLARPGNAFRGTSGAALARDRADALTRRYLAARRAHFRVLFGQTVGAVSLQVGASAALLGLGGWLVLQRELTLGQLVAAELIVTTVTSSVAKLGKLLDNTYDLLTAFDKVGHVLDLPIEEEGMAEHLPGQGPLRVEVETQGLSLVVKAGERAALLLPPGHPMADWLAGVRLPVAGAIRLNGVETRRARSAELHEEIAVIDAQGLIRGSVLDNVVMGRDRISPPDVRAALQRVGVLDAVCALPEGLDTRLGSEGHPLDASQRLRVLVARALAGMPRLIVVDTSLDGLAPTERAEVIGSLIRPGAPWTLISLVNDIEGPLARSSERVISLERAS